MKRIGISASFLSPGQKRLFEALGELLSFSYEEWTLENNSMPDGWIISAADHNLVSRITGGDRPGYIIVPDDQLVPWGESSRIDFGMHAQLPSILAARQIMSEEAAGWKVLPEVDDVTVLASKEGAPIWAIREHGRVCHHYVTIPIPALNKGEALFSHFNGRRFLTLLPLLLFLRALTEDQRWETPPLQACFMFDDANLHWPTYGFINFAKMAQHASIHNYHICFATIPLDAWYVHLRTASLFEQNRDRLSLLVHGNDHTAREFAKPYADEERRRILGEALDRISKLERRSGIEVSRVMVPPQEACSEALLAEMAQHGLEAACVSSGSLRRYNSTADWVRTVGLSPTDILKGLPVFNRFSLSKNCCNSALVAALLRQPIIAVGHHQDVAAGLEILAELSTFVNSLGFVRWADMKRIARSHFGWMIDGRVLHVRMFTKCIEIRAPEGVREILVEYSRLQQFGTQTIASRVLGKDSEWSIRLPMEPIAVQAGQEVEIVSGFAAPALIDLKTHRRLNAWPIVRRQLTEARDRIPPALQRLVSSVKGRVIG